MCHNAFIQRSERSEADDCNGCRVIVMGQDTEQGGCLYVPSPLLSPPHALPLPMPVFFGEDSWKFQKRLKLTESRMLQGIHAAPCARAPMQTHSHTSPLVLMCPCRHDCRQAHQLQCAAARVGALVSNTLSAARASLLEDPHVSAFFYRCLFSPPVLLMIRVETFRGVRRKWIAQQFSN